MRPVLHGTVLVLAMTCAATCPADAAPRELAQCALSQQILKETDKPAVYDAVSLIRPIDPLVQIGPENRRRISPSLLAALKRAAESNAFVSCPELRIAISKGARFASKKEVEEHTSVRDPVGTSFTYLATPIVSDDGRAALAIIGDECTGRCGGFTAYVYRRTKTTWVRDREMVAGAIR